MLQQQVYIINLILMGLDAVLVIAAGYSSYYGCVYFDELVPGQFSFLVYIIVVMFINNYVVGCFGLYSDRTPSRLRTIFLSLLKTVPINFIFLSATGFIFEPEYYPRFFLFLFSILVYVYIAIFRTITITYLVWFAKGGNQLRKILIVADSERGKAVSDALRNQLSWGHEIVGRVSERTEPEIGCGPESGSLGTIDNLAVILRGIPVDEVVFALDGDRNIKLNEYLQICQKMGVCVRIVPALWNGEQHKITVECCQGIPFINFRASSFEANDLLYKRFLDILGGAVGLLLLLIILPFVSLLIKLDSSGPVIFKQKRKGQHGRIFELYKFRTMYENAEEMKERLLSQNEMNGHMFKLANDPRVTRVGRFLRKTSLDEFPQFINVLKGEMSLVGTRPPTIQEVEQYQPEHLKRIAFKPGITGLWQISGRNKINDFEKVVELDCQYLANWKFSDDLKILLKTVLIVLQRKGAS